MLEEEQGVTALVTAHPHIFHICVTRCGVLQYI